MTRVQSQISSSLHDALPHDSISGNGFQASFSQVNVLDSQSRGNEGHSEQGNDQFKIPQPMLSRGRPQPPPAYASSTDADESDVVMENDGDMDEWDKWAKSVDEHLGCIH